MSALPLISQHRSRQMAAGLLRARNDRRQRESIETKARKFLMADQAIKRLGRKLRRVSPEDILTCCICTVTPNGAIHAADLENWVACRGLIEPRKLIGCRMCCWPSGQRKGPGRYALRAKLEIRPSRLEEPGGATPAPPPNKGRAT
jgi:hypothetical protein